MQESRFLNIRYSPKAYETIKAAALSKGVTPTKAARRLISEWIALGRKWPEDIHRDSILKERQINSLSTKLAAVSDECIDLRREVAIQRIVIIALLVLLVWAIARDMLKNKSPKVVSMPCPEWQNPSIVPEEDVLVEVITNGFRQGRKWKAFEDGRPADVKGWRRIPGKENSSK